MAALEHAAEEQIDTRAREVGADGAERLLGVIAVAGGKGVAKILDIKAMLEAAFATRGRARPRDAKPGASGAVHEERRETEVTETLVTFEVAGQEFALPLTDVQEIIPAPTSVIALAHSEAVVLGLTAVRDMLLPLLSLRALLGFSSTAGGVGPGKGTDRQGRRRAHWARRRSRARDRGRGYEAP